MKRPLTDAEMRELEAWLDNLMDWLSRHDPVCAETLANRLSEHHISSVAGEVVGGSERVGGEGVTTETMRRVFKTGDIILMSSGSYSDYGVGPMLRVVTEFELISQGVRPAGNFDMLQLERTEMWVLLNQHTELIPWVEIWESDGFYGERAAFEVEEHGA